MADETAGSAPEYGLALTRVPVHRPHAEHRWPVNAGLTFSTRPGAAETATPRSIPTTWPLPGAGTGAGITAKATCQRPARSIVTR
jgi:hypothetical protein